MDARVKQSLGLLLTLALVAALAMPFGMIPSSMDRAWAVTAAEKQAEADSVWDQIDSLQTSLNEAMEQHSAAEAAYHEAEQLAAEAAAQVQEESEKVKHLQGELSEFAVGMYKESSAGTFLDVILQTTSFEAFLTSWDICSSISDKGATLLHESQEAKRRQQEAQARFEEQKGRAEDQMRLADETMNRIQETQEALRVEASKLTAEAAELQVQEELAAEAARQAEEARIQREAQLAAGSGYFPGDSVLMGSGYFTHPCPGAALSSGFGYRSFDGSFHKGVDLAAGEGTPYYAADSGTVMYATNDGGYNGGAGNWVVISHGNGIVTKYMHSSAVFVSPGQYVERGQNIGAVGNTGQSFGAHLHFQVEVGGVAVNPLNYI